jgi:hypothetical protein
MLAIFPSMERYPALVTNGPARLKAMTASEVDLITEYEPPLTERAEDDR